MDSESPEFILEPLEESSPRRKSKFARYWEKSGGGSLMVSIVVHGILVVIAVLWLWKTATTAEKDPVVEFLPGGGGGQDGAKPEKVRMQQKSMQKTAPALKLASSSPTSSFALPDTTASVNMSQFSMASRTAGAMGSGHGSGAGGGVGSGIGTGMGSGFGPGKGPGFISTSIFGSTAAVGLPGNLYDMKQDAKRNAMPYNGGVEEFFPRVYEVAKKKFRKSSFDGFYRARVTLSYTMLAVPNVAAEEGPKAFHAEQEIQPRGWFIHYHGKIDPPQVGEWRFAGVFDDALLVYVNNKLVFDGSYDSTSPAEVRGPFGGTVFAGSVVRPFVGKWVSLQKGSTLDIVIGERPGGRVGGMLLVQQKGKKYAEREKDVPILPVFSFVQPRPEDRERINQMGFAIAEETPIFKVYTDRFSTFPDKEDEDDK